MTKNFELLTASECVAAAAAACRADFIAYSHSIKEFSKAAPVAHTQTMAAESDSAACYASIGACALEKRAIAATTGNIQDEVSCCASLRLPVAFINFSPQPCKTALNFFPENNQELIDYIILGYRASEDKKVMLPAVISYNNAGLREAVQVPTQQSIDKIIPKLRVAHRLGKDALYLFQQKNWQQQAAAMTHAENTIKKAAEQFWQKFHRKAGFYDSYMAEDAEHILICRGVNTINSKKTITAMRSQGKKVGLLKLKSTIFTQDIKKSIEGKNAAMLCTDNFQSQPQNTALKFITSEIPTEKDFEEIFKKLAAGENGTYWV